MNAVKTAAFVACTLLAKLCLAEPGSFADALVAQRVRQGYTLTQKGTVLNQAITADAFSRKKGSSPFTQELVAPASVRVVNLVIDSGQRTLPSPPGRTLSVGLVSSKASGTPGIGNILITNPKALQKINSSISVKLPQQ